MANTTPYSIYYPIASDSVAPLHTAFSTLADSVNTAMTTYVAPLIASQQNGAYTAATPGTLPTGVATGSTCFVTQNGAIYVYNGTAWKLMYQPWTAYTIPAIVSFSRTIVQYMVLNQIAIVQIKLTATGTTPTDTSLLIPYPFAQAAVDDLRMPVGSGTLFDSSGTTAYELAVWQNSTTAAKVVYKTGSPLKSITYNPSSATPVTIANPDVIVLNFTCRVD